MFGAEKPNILPDQGLKFTCAVCGDLLNPVDALAGFPLGKSHKCKTCKQSVCGKHFSASRQKCVKCETGRDSWCKTPAT